ncbi:MAG: hypothetical protein MUC71_04390 [Steroidobacteraceae bacterium]|nr:hypothetical protein [Steroidobacteraceae bacterium]
MALVVGDLEEGGHVPLRDDQAVAGRDGEPVAVDYLYSLYDALVSINVPSEKARAVVDAMERDMGTTLATKQDLKLLEHQLAGMRTELRQEIENRYELLSREIGSLRADMAKDFGSLRAEMAKEIGSLRAEMAKEIGALRSEAAKDQQVLRSDFAREQEALRLSMTLRLGSMLAVGVGLSVSVILGVLRLWL